MCLGFEKLLLEQVLRLGFITALANLTKSESLQCHSDVEKLSQPSLVFILLGMETWNIQVSGSRLLLRP